jgi:uncharacterized protein
MVSFHQIRFSSILLIFLVACAARSSKVTPTLPPTSISSTPWTEESVTFPSGSNKLYGALNLPNKPGPFPAIVLISGSANEYSGLRPGIFDVYMKDQAQNMVKNGFAILRYDPPGVGLSTGDSRFETIDDRVEEAMAALHYLQSRTDILPDRIGLWGVSQGGWVIGMAAADNPQDVAFLVSVSGAGISIAEQQVWGVETQTRALGLTESNVTKAALFARLLIDWQLSKPIYQAANQAAAAQLGDGPWQDFMKLVYEPGGITPTESLQAGIKILEAVQDEPWTEALYIKSVYLPSLNRMTPEQWTDWVSNTSQSLLIDPKNFLPKVTSPVLAFFGEDDQLVPAQKSAELFEQYLSQAGNKNFRIVVLPNADHGLFGATNDYWKILAEWLGRLFSEPD